VSANAGAPISFAHCSGSEAVAGAKRIQPFSVRKVFSAFLTVA
jgi:hypothetical protein